MPDGSRPRSSYHLNTLLKQIFQNVQHSEFVPAYMQVMSEAFLEHYFTVFFSTPARLSMIARLSPLSILVESLIYFVLSYIKKLSWLLLAARQDWLDLGPGLLAWWTNEGKLSARFSIDLLPGFEMLAGKCVLCDTDYTVRNATAHTSWIPHSQKIYIEIFHLSWVKYP